MNSHSRPSSSGALIATLLILAATLAAGKLVEVRRPASLAQSLESIDLDIAGFKGSSNAALGDAVLGKLLPTAYLSRTYRKPTLALDLFIAFYAQQRAGESMHSPKHCLPGAGWEIWDYASAEVPVNGRSFPVNKYSISHENEKMLVLYWYQSKDRIIASEYLGKVLLARDALLQNSTAASIVRIIVPDTPEAFAEARAFASELIPKVRRCFGD
jgi:EpsI family protein